MKTPGSSPASASRRAWRTALACGAAALLLTACGGSDEISAPVVDDTVLPAGATASVAAFNGYVGQLVVDDTREPVALGMALPPTSDEDEPSLIR
ncbi:hypothetical protein [Rubrivivax rivuli]|uniref:Uncharacterized protein n=1 Tax=Rubrivivax rivuli TaxID=1862385 RepID=A0A437RS39_9BURK|nr:hypothetical protein [Rubrivivax rivuli]RVU49567.1 hypothetical protein EOE66_03130 [Rubrivivax rivuli]